ncbi:MAG: glycosyltransferase family 2 protein [Clostridia bacterium]|nr:glycosyltransferase family 2 protein [Clostridia bacterium]
MDPVVLIVPSLQPDDRLPAFLQTVRQYREQQAPDTALHILLVDDGSGPDYARYFDAQEQNGCVVLRHEVNRGKGAALKTAFRQALTQFPQAGCYVTADSDGQHTAEDVFRCAAAAQQHPDAIVLGCRDFNGLQVPSRNRFGNRMTCKVLHSVTGFAVTDTQTGLRAFSPAVVRQLTDVRGDRFEYETNVFLRAAQNDIPLHEVPIHTIYEPGGGTHFRPIRDSWKIYRLFRKSILCALLLLWLVPLALMMADIGSSFGWPLQWLLFAACILAPGVLQYIVWKRQALHRRRTLLRYMLTEAGRVAAESGLAVLICRQVACPPLRVIALILLTACLPAIAFFLQHAGIPPSAKK